MELLATKEMQLMMKSMVLPSFHITKVNLNYNLTPFLGRGRLSSDFKCSLKWQIKLKNTTDPFPSLILQSVAYQFSFHQSRDVPGLIRFSCVAVARFLVFGQRFCTGTWRVRNGTTYRGCVFPFPLLSPFNFPIQNSPVSPVLGF